MYGLDEIFAKIMGFISQMNNLPKQQNFRTMFTKHNFQDYNVFEGYLNSANKMSILTSLPKPRQMTYRFTGSASGNSNLYNLLNFQMDPRTFTFLIACLGVQDLNLKINSSKVINQCLENVCLCLNRNSSSPSFSSRCLPRFQIHKPCKFTQKSVSKHIT